MSNLYVWVDARSRDKLARTVGELAHRHPQFRQFLTEGDGIQDVLNLVFPHGMPMEYYAANLSIENRPEENLNLALRPVVSPEQPWPFPKGCSLAVRGFWRATTESDGRRPVYFPAGNGSRYPVCRGRGIPHR